MAVCTEPTTTEADRILIHFPFTVIGDEKIKLSIVVIVDPSGSRTPHLLPLVHRHSHSSLVGNISESAIVVIVIEMVFRHAGNVNILPPIVVIIPDGHAHVEAIARQPSLFGHISEGAVMIVV